MANGWLSLLRLSPVALTSEIWAWWKHGFWVIMTLGFFGFILSIPLFAGWLVLNVPFILAMDGWGFHEAMTWFSWLAPVWAPLSYGLASQYLPSPPSDEALS